MTRKELAHAAARLANFHQAAGLAFTIALFDVIIDAVRRGEPVEIMHFGKFTVKERKPPPSFRDPRTGHKIGASDRPMRRLAFQPAKLTKEMLNKPPAEWSKKHRRLMQMEEML